MIAWAIIFWLDFNPRTREGCDKVSFLLFGCHPDFNPRTREGCDSYAPSLVNAN